MKTRPPDRGVPVADTEAGTGKALVRRLLEDVVNGGELAVLDELLAPDSSVLAGRAAPVEVKEVLARYRAAVPDVRWTISEQVAENGTVVTFFVASGTQRGPLWGVPASGRSMAVSGTLVSRCRDGRITAQWLQLDLLGLLQQLGVMPDLSLANGVIVARLARESPHGYRT